MKVAKNESLAAHTTIKIGGVADNFYTPESVDELLSLVNKLDEYKILSAGSILLINDKVHFKNVIYMGNACKELRSLGGGRYYCGASVRIQKLISVINQDGYGGIEELVSVPAMIGRMIYMNASIGNDVVVLSDCIVSVDAINEGKKVTLSREECAFTHRASIFHNDKYIIIGAEFQFPVQAAAVSEEKRKKRLESCKQKLDYSGYNFGSVFRKCDYKLMNRLSRFGIKKGNISLSRKTTNWLLNNGGGTYKQAMAVIETCKRIHKLFGKKAELEVCVWDK